MPSAVLSTEAEEYLSWLAVERGRATLTLAAYRRDLAAYEAALAAGGRTPSGATMRDVEEYVATMRSSEKSPSTVARSLSVLRGLHRFLLEEDVASSDPTVDVAGARPALRLPKALSEPDVTALLLSANGTAPRQLRDRALLEFLYGTGARISETVGLDLADLADDEGLVRLYGKGSKERLVPLGRCAAAALDDWLGSAGRPNLVPKRWARRGDSEAVFLNARGGRLTRQGAFAVVRDHARKAGLKVPVSPHALRHSCATHMLAHGADIRVVQELLGHVSIATTQLYTKVSPEHLRAAYESAHPRARRSA
jgi:integrase/recombinase XerD